MDRATRGVGNKECFGIGKFQYIGRHRCVSQYGMGNGQAYNQKASYLDSEDLWIWAFWQPEESYGTFWTTNHPQYNPNSGAGTLLLLPNMIYHQQFQGQRQKMRERMEIRVGEDLWDAVPTFPPSRVSQWASALADAVYVTSWSHDSAAELRHYLQWLKRIAGPSTDLFTSWASWGAGGHDAFLPDSMWLTHNPPYGPNHLGYGNLDQMRALAEIGDAAGWFSFRTFYAQIRDSSPSVQAGDVSAVLGSTGQPHPPVGTFAKRGELPPIYQRQEAEIRSHLGPTATFTDTICAGYPFAYRDYDPTVTDGLRMQLLVSQDKTLANFLEATHGGPVACEALVNETLLGQWAATGEFDLKFGKGRLVTPEYKLRRLHGLSTFHGLGLNYRFSNITQLWSSTRPLWRNQDELDAYRTAQMLFGNGAFVYVENNLEDTIWSHVISEVLMVGALQKHFALQPISTIEYETTGQSPGTWSTLQDLVENQSFVMKTNPGRTHNANTNTTTDLPQSAEFERIRVTYGNGLEVVVNRGSANFTVNANGQSIVLPPDGWAASGTLSGASVLAYSGFAPGTSHRIDFYEDYADGVRFVDPRGGTHEGVVRPTQWVRKDGTWRVRLEADLEGAWPAVTLEGQRIPLSPARDEALTTLDTDFTQGLGGWRTIKGVREPVLTTSGLRLDATAENTILHGPRMRLAGGAGDVIEVDVRFDAPASGTGRLTVIFKREQDGTYTGTRAVGQSFPITGGWQTVAIPVGGHSVWPGETIKSIRLDPRVVGSPAPPFDLTVGAVRWVAGP
ncbi:MAG: hypothetical protein AAGM22_14410 [Acidobacteriota bacterium]